MLFPYLHPPIRWQPYEQAKWTDRQRGLPRLAPDSAKHPVRLKDSHYIKTTPKKHLKIGSLWSRRLPFEKNSEYCFNASSLNPVPIFPSFLKSNQLPCKCSEILPTIHQNKPAKTRQNSPFFCLSHNTRQLAPDPSNPPNPANNPFSAIFSPFQKNGLLSASSASAWKAHTSRFPPAF